MKAAVSVMLIALGCMSCTRSSQPTAAEGPAAVAQPPNTVSMTPSVQRESGVETMLLEMRTVPQIRGSGVQALPSTACARVRGRQSFSVDVFIG